MKFIMFCLTFCGLLICCTGTIGDTQIDETTQENKENNNVVPVSSTILDGKPHCPDIPIRILDEDGVAKIFWESQPCDDIPDSHPSMPDPDPGPF